MRSPLCGVAEAIRILARQPREAPADPCRDVFDELPQHQRSRWLLSFLPALRALTAWTGDGYPPAPDDWRELEPRLGLRSARSLWPFDLDAIWLSRVEAMRGHCEATGVEASALLERWAPYETAALSHFEACEMRNHALPEAAANLRAIAVAASGPMMAGRDVRTGRVDEIPRAVLFDPAARWTTDDNAEHYSAEIIFTGGLRTPTAVFTDVTFAAADIDALMGAQAPRSAPADRRLCSAVRRAALEVFPGGPPAGMRVRTRDDLIIAQVIKMGAAKPSPRTIRAGISGLWPHPSRRRRT